MFEDTFWRDAAHLCSHSGTISSSPHCLGFPKIDRHEIEVETNSVSHSDWLPLVIRWLVYSLLVRATVRVQQKNGMGTVLLHRL